MGIAIKNLGIISYTKESSEFSYIPAQYLQNDLESSERETPKEFPASADIKDQIRRTLNDILEPTYTLAKQDLDNRVWEADPAKTEDGVKEWESALRLTNSYLTKKI